MSHTMTHWVRSYPGLDVLLLPWEDNVVATLVSGGQAMVVDPPAMAPVHELLCEVEAMLHGVLITHEDGDHVAGVPELVKAWRHPKVYAPEGAHVDFDFEPLRGGEVLNWRGMEIRVLNTRGHRSRHVSFYLPQPKPGLLFSGDSLFAGGCGRIFGNPPEWMFESLRSLAALPPETDVYCGHDYLEANLAFGLSVEPGNAAMRQRLEVTRARHHGQESVLPSTIALELETNPFLRVADVESFAALRRAKDAF